LLELLEILYLAAAVPEELRYPQFNVVAVPSTHTNVSELGDVWVFDDPRKLSVDEVRRLAPAVDPKKSALFLKWTDAGWQIVGLVDLGTSCNRARIGLQYQYHSPSCLYVVVDKPGRIKVYQGQYIVAALRDGQLERHEGFDLSLVLHSPTHNGLKKIWDKITYPRLESPREYENFQFIAFWNTLAALANCIGEEAHGGAIVIVPSSKSISKELRVKYRQNSSILSDAFVAFMNYRHLIADVVFRLEQEEKGLEGEYAIAELKLAASHLKLVEAIRFVARLAGCDGAIIISEDLILLGFGGEIRSEMKSNAKVVDIIDDVRKVSRPLDVESFGLRHRSAIKFVSRQPAACVLVVSQDGPISYVWSDKPCEVKVRRGVTLTNMNMPWA